jgi:hypothetical protein
MATAHYTNTNNAIIIIIIIIIIRVIMDLNSQSHFQLLRGLSVYTT